MYLKESIRSNYSSIIRLKKKNQKLMQIITFRQPFEAIKDRDLVDHLVMAINCNYSLSLSVIN